MREERALFILRACNNALLSYVAIFFLRIVFDPAASFFDPADLMVAFFAVCATVCKNFWGSVMCHMLTNGVAVSLMLLLMLFKDYLLN